MSKEKLKVLIVSSEVNPYAKSGGLGDVIGSLPKELIANGVDARVVVPKYKTINKDLLKDMEYINNYQVTLGYRNDSASLYKLDKDFPLYLIENDYFFGRDGFYGYGDDFERFSFFCEATINMLNHIDFKPDVLHLNDWQTALCGVYLKDKYSRFLFFEDIKILYTIHNLQYQGVFGEEVLTSIGLDDRHFNSERIEYFNKVNFTKAGLVYSDMISTVSRTYAKEIQTSDFGYGLDGVLRARSDDLYGIENGIDVDINNPETDKIIYANFSKDDISNKAVNKSKLQEELNLPVKDVPVIGIISRLADQKGFDLINIILEELLLKDIQIVLLGTGDGRYEELFKHYAYRFPDKLSANIFFSGELAQKIYASSDMFLMPSLFEPCGLGQMFAMRYGTIPIARKTGGLSDTISHYHETNREGTGFLFEDYLASGLMWAINEALRQYANKENWNEIVINAMNKDFSWDNSSKRYIELYKKMSNK